MHHSLGHTGGPRRKADQHGVAIARIGGTPLGCGFRDDDRAIGTDHDVRGVAEPRLEHLAVRLGQFRRIGAEGGFASRGRQRDGKRLGALHAGDEDTAPCPHPCRCQALGGVECEPVQFAPRPAAIVAIDQRERIRIRARMGRELRP